MTKSLSTAGELQEVNRLAEELQGLSSDYFGKAMEGEILFRISAAHILVSSPAFKRETVIELAKKVIEVGGIKVKPHTLENWVSVYLHKVQPMLREKISVVKKDEVYAVSLLLEEISGELYQSGGAWSNLRKGLGDGKEKENKPCGHKCDIHK